ncbi:response regulator [Limnobacter sp.]|uniref:response regulator n=1 Tax=Limnobacter sp. TaxID=2003368 RepID=UPI00258550F3|nr:response regulator [Limnobacter sp.]
MKVLVIEDDNIHRILVVSLLLECGQHTVLEAASYEDAKRILYGPDFIPLIISDIRLQNYLALELLEGAREDGCLEGSHVLMMTAHPEREWVLHAQRLGVKGFLIKPFALELAKKTIQKAIDELESSLLFDQRLASVGNLSPQDLERLKAHVDTTLTPHIGVRQLTELQVLFASSGLNHLCFCVKRIIHYKNRISWNRHVERKAIQDLRRHFFSSFDVFLTEQNNAECR